MKKKIINLFKKINAAFRRYIDGKDGRNIKEEFTIFEEKWDQRFKVSLGTIAITLFVIGAFVYVFFLKGPFARAAHWLFVTMLYKSAVKPFYSGFLDNPEYAINITTSVLFIAIIIFIVFTVIRYLNKLLKYLNSRW